MFRMLAAAAAATVVALAGSAAQAATVVLPAGGSAMLGVAEAASITTFELAGPLDGIGSIYILGGYQRGFQWLTWTGSSYEYLVYGDQGDVAQVCDLVSSACTADVAGPTGQIVSVEAWSAGVTSFIQITNRLTSYNTCGEGPEGDCMYTFHPLAVEIYSSGSSDETVHFTTSASPLSAVPEPGVWALLIVGFGLTGSALRRSSHRNVERRQRLRTP